MPQGTTAKPIPDSATVRITFRETDRSASAGGFWHYIQQHMTPAARFASGEEMERRLRREFGMVLRNLLLTEFLKGRAYGVRNGSPGESATAERESAAEAGAAPLFALDVASDINYGSMSFDLCVAGLRGFLGFFDSNWQLFRIAFVQYCPIALAILASGYAGPADGMAIDQLAVAVEPSQEMIDAFNRASAGAVDGSARQGLLDGLRVRDAANWAWISSNTSLLVPVLMALVVLYVAHRGVERERRELQAGILALEEQQTRVIRLLADARDSDRPGAEKTGNETVARARRRPVE